MEKTIKIAGWTIFVLLTLGMGFLLIARYTPALMVHLIGTNGRAGQLAKICNCSQNTILIEEIIDNDSGIGVEGGAGFDVQLKKLLLVNTEKMESRKIGLHLNTRLIACSPESIWLFDDKRGIYALATKNGREQVDQERILKINPALKNRLSGTAEDFGLSPETQQLLVEDIERNYWLLDRNFLAHQLLTRPAIKAHRTPEPEFKEITQGSMFHPLSLLNDGDTRLILHYKNKLSEGLRLTLMKETGQGSWQQNFDHLLDRKQEKCHPAAVYQTGNKVLLLILDTSRGTRLIWLDKMTGNCLKNQRV